VVFVDSRDGVIRHCHRATGELAVARKGRQIEIPTVVQLVGATFANQALHLINDLRDEVMSSCVGINGVDVESAHVVDECPLEASSEVMRRYTNLVRPRDDLVIDISDVLNMFNAVAAKAEIPSHNIELHERLCMTYMAQVIDRWTTHKHLNVTVVAWDESFLAPGECVIDRQLGHQMGSRGMPRMACRA
jgi:hypothetical protein